MTFEELKHKAERGELTGADIHALTKERLMAVADAFIEGNGWELIDPLDFWLMIEILSATVYGEDLESDYITNRIREWLIVRLTRGPLGKP